jgi:hypothetical protein
MAEKQSKHTLTAKEIEIIHKMPTARLLRKLSDIGLPDEQLELMERDDLLRAWTSAVADGRDKPVLKTTGDQPRPIIMDPILAEKQLEFERYKLDQEIKQQQELQQLEKDKMLQQQKLEADKLQWQREQEQLRQTQLNADREMHIHIQQEQARAAARYHELELAARQRETAIRREQADAQANRAQEQDERRNSLVERAKRYGDILKNALPKMPQDIWQLAAYFDTVENLFKTFEVPVELQTCLLRPFLSERALSLLTHLDADRSSKLSEVRKYLLEQFNLTALQFRNKFNTVTKQKGESYALYCSRLRSLLSQYFEHRHVNGDYNTLVDLLISDRLHVNLPEHVIKYLTTLEMTTAEGWLKSVPLSETLDNYFSIHTYDGKPLMATSVTSRVDNSLKYDRPTQGYNSNAYDSNETPSSRYHYDQSLKQVTPNRNVEQNRHQSLGNRPMANERQASSSGRSCFICSSTSHLRKDCPHRDKQYGNKGTQDTNRIANKTNGARVFTCSAYNKPNDVRQPMLRPICNDGHCLSNSPVADERMHTLASMPGYEDQAGSHGTARSADCDTSQHGGSHTRTPNETIPKGPYTLSRLSVNNDCHTALPDDNTDTMNKRIPSLADDFSQLVYIPIQFANGTTVLNGLYDSGAELSVLAKGVLPHEELQRVGQVKLRGIFGDPVDADLVLVKMRLADSPQNSDYLNIHCAICEGVNDPLVLTADVVRKLTQLRNAEHTQVKCLEIKNTEQSSDINGISNALQQITETEPINDCFSDTDNNTIDCDDSVDDDNLNCETADWQVDHALGCTQKADIEKLINEQKSDLSLQQAWTLATQTKNGYHVNNGLLFHRDRILGQKVNRLVLPIDRRKTILSLAHDTSHVSAKRTRQRLQPTFHWPTMRSDVNKYCLSCLKCQLRRRKTYLDRTPISAIKRASFAFQHWFIDTFQLSANLPLKYNHCLVCVDSFSRWPAAFPLRKVTAKAVCDCLIQLFSHTNLPTTISSDNASTFCSEMNKVFLQRFGIAPLFITPTHASANGLSERMVQSLKNMICKMAVDHKDRWPSVLTMALWALREIPCETTGCSPSLLVFGQLPHGPLSILRDSWTGENITPRELKRPVADYLKDLKHNLHAASQYAMQHSEYMQSKYVDYYNQHSRHKSFDKGQQVLILTPDSTHKTFSQWLGPATVIEQHSDYGYFVEFEGVRRNIHADKLRPFHLRVDEIICDVNVVSSQHDRWDIMTNEPSVATSDSIIPNSMNVEKYALTVIKQTDSDCITNKCEIPMNECNFTVQCSGCAVIFERDEEFGNIQAVESPHNSSLSLSCVDLPPSTRIPASELSHLNNEHRKELLSLLDSYSDRFTEKPGFCDVVEHELRMKPEFKPRRFKAYKVPEHLKAAVSEQIKQLLQYGFIEPIDSPQTSPMVCIMKGKTVTDGVRLAFDFRWVNQFTEDTAYPIGDITDLIHKVGQARFISLFDAKSGYWQTPIRKDQRYLTSFVCEEGQFAWNRTPFGLKNAGYTYVKALKQILEPVKRCTASYIDEVAVYTNTWATHMKMLDKFLQVIRQSGITFNFKNVSLPCQK